MKKNICLAAGIAGVLLGTLPSVLQADGRMHGRGWGAGPSWGWGGPYWGWHGRYVVIDERPSFIVLPDYGLSVSVGTSYDILYYDNLYYVYDNADWFSSPDYRGPWVPLQDNELPDVIRKHRVEDIRKVRDMEFQKKGNAYKRNNQRDIQHSRNLNESHSDTPSNDSEE